MSSSRSARCTAPTGELTHWVVAFSDRSEVEKLRAELEGLKALAAAP